MVRCTRPRGVAALGAALLLAGCGVTFDVTQVPRDQLARDMTGRAGVMYALPKTELRITVPVTVKTTTFGWLAEGLDKALLGCRASSPAAPTAKKTLSVAVLGAPTIAAVPVPDLDEVYIADASTLNPFVNVNHTMALSGSGMIQSFDGAASSVAAGVATNVIKTALAILPLGAGATAAPAAAPAAASTTGTANGKGVQPQSDKQEPQMTTKSTRIADERCTALLAGSSVAIDESRLPSLERNEAIALWLLGTDDRDLRHCPAVQCIAAAMSDLRAEAVRERGVEQASLDGTVASDAELGLMQARAAAAKARRMELEARLDALRKHPAMQYSTEEKPLEAVAHHAPAKSATAKPSLNWRYDGAALSKPESAAVSSQLAGVALKVSTVEPLVPASAPTTTASDSSSRRGHRYRMPAIADVEVTVGGSTAAFDQVPVAQFGVVAALPSLFAGRKANLNFTLGPAGGLTSVTYGQEATSGNAIGDVGDAIVARRAAKQAAAAAAASAPAAALAAELELVNGQIALDKARRCKAALQADRTGPVPEVCK
jgi:hypothetical protein